ncbi:MAG: sodium:calcium antiporter, partial [Myxococcota bacterium]
MIGSSASILVGLALLYIGAEGLVRGSSRLALRSGLSRLTVGLTVVAFGTGSPELVVSLEATIMNRQAIAVGNVVGSNIANLGLILGLAVLIRPMVIQSKLVRLDLPILATCSALLMLLL